MIEEFKLALVKSEEELLENIKINNFLISECDIQAMHYSILTQHFRKTDFVVSTEWSLKKEEFGKIDLVAFKKWGQKMIFQLGKTEKSVTTKLYLNI